MTNKTKERTITFKETYYDNGEVDVRMFTESGKDITAPNAKFVTEYKERIKGGLLKATMTDFINRSVNR